MENRITGEARRPGPALLALLGILAITAAWWALALWPAGAVEPEWLARTRAACFGSVRGGLPHAGGWVLLIGEPIGMFGFLMMVWGGAVKRDVAWAMAHPYWRFAATAIAVLALAGIAAATTRVARATAAMGAEPHDAEGTVVRVDRQPPAIALVDQHGKRTALPDFKGQTVLLTFAFGHCTTVCPVVVNRVLAARQRMNRPDVPLVVITLDPWRDTPDRLATIATRWELAPGDRVLSGSIADVRRVLDDLGVHGRRNTTTGDIDHTATVMLLERGHIRQRLEGGWAAVDQLIATAR